MDSEPNKPFYIILIAGGFGIALLRFYPSSQSVCDTLDPVNCLPNQFDPLQYVFIDFNFVCLDSHLSRRKRKEDSEVDESTPILLADIHRLLVAAVRLSFG